MNNFFFNPESESPTAGMRGVVAAVIAAAGPFFLDWRTMALPLIVVVVGGVLTSLSLFSTAAKAVRK